MKKIIKLLRKYEKIKDISLYLELYPDYSGKVVDTKAKDEEIIFEFSSKDDLMYQLLDNLQVEY